LPVHSLICPPPSCPLFPYTTLFRSKAAIVQSVFVHWDQPREWVLELSPDGQNWSSFEPTWTTAAAVDPVPARFVRVGTDDPSARSEEHTSELQSRENLVCRLLLEKK